MYPSVPSEVRNNVVKLLMYHSNGIPSDQFLNRYKVCMYIHVYVRVCVILICKISSSVINNQGLSHLASSSHKMVCF
jgi:hypothetical protein